MAELYRHYGEDNKLLYVGVSLSTAQRLAQHRDYSHWFEKIIEVKIQRFATREEALAAEKKAIKDEKPACNVLHNKPKRSFLDAVADRRLELQEIAKRIEESESELTRQIVSVSPMYIVQEAAKALCLRPGDVDKLIATGAIGHVEFPPSREGCRSRIRITGWQLLEYLEHISAPANAQLIPSAQLHAIPRNTVQYQNGRNHKGFQGDAVELPLTNSGLESVAG